MILDSHLNINTITKGTLINNQYSSETIIHNDTLSGGNKWANTFYQFQISSILKQRSSYVIHQVHQH